LAYAAANISNPLLAPLIVWIEIQLGSLMLDGTVLSIRLSQLKGPTLLHLAIQIATGAIALGVTLSVIGGLLAANIARWAIKKRSASPMPDDFPNLAEAITRTCARFHSATAADRYYVANKLRFDPIVRILYETSLHLGDVVDIGCGRGQLGLLLHELGRIRSLTGFDWDELKIDTAQCAAQQIANFSVLDVCSAPIPEADTVLIIDVLHYLPLPAQDEILSRAAAALRQGGRLIVRDVDARRAIRSLVTQWLEHLGTRCNINRGSTLTFRSRQQLCDTLKRHGLAKFETVAMPGLCLDNVLILATRGEPQA
jgi:2-polyprenyl-3-methyl-5-hydroxy-6-metoxy-1,4-benzoquinol methylase